MNRSKWSFLLAAVALCLCLSLFAGCGYNPESVMTVDGTPVKAGRYLYFQLDAAYAAIDQYSDSAVMDAGIFDVELDGVPAREWIANRAMQNCLDSVYIDSEFARLGLEFDSFNEYYVEYEASTVWNSYSSLYLRNGVGYETFLEMQKLPYKQSQVIQALYGEGGEHALSAEEKQAYFEENYTRIDYIQFPTTDASGGALSTASQTRIREIAGEMAQAANETELRALYMQLYPEVLTLTGSTETVSGEAFDELYLDNTLVSTTSSGMDADFIAEIFTAKDNAYHLFEKDGVCYLYRSNGLSEADDIANYELEIVTRLGTEPFTALMDEATAAFDVQTDTRAMNYYSQDKIVFG